MIGWLQRNRPEKREAELLIEARCHAVEHEAAAEHHAALARMYRGREQRLTNAASANVALIPTTTKERSHDHRNG